MMASEASIQCQEVVKCKLCEKPVSFYCRRCVVNLCDPCALVHLRVKSEFGHDIIDIGSKNENDSCFCDAHPQYTCSAYCKTCDLVICILCVSIRHKSHEITELSDNIELFKCFSREKSRLQSFKNELEPILNHTTKLLSSLSSIYQKKKDEVTFRGEKWQRVVEKTVKKHQQELENLKKEHKIALLEQKNLIEEKIEKITEITRKATRLQKSNDVEEMRAFRPVIEGQETTQKITQYSFPTFCESKIDEKYLQTYFGYIEKIPERNILLPEGKIQSDIPSNKKVMEVPIVTSVIDSLFPSDMKHSGRLYDMAVIDDQNVWMGGEGRELKLFDLQGNHQHSVTLTCTGLYICAYNNQVVFTDNLNKSVKRVSDNDIVMTMFMTGDQNPFGITSTASGDFLVCLRKGDQSKVVRYSSTGTVLQEIEYDSHCQPLYQFAWYITENVNGDVIATDCKKKKVIAVDRVGVPRYSYRGTNKGSDFSSIVTDSVGRVIITDFMGDKIHLLDRDGKFLRYIIPQGEGIENPRAVCIIGDGELIVGECLTGLAKRIKYLEEQT